MVFFEAQHEGGPSDHLVIPDEHYYPGDNFRRCEWLGKYIMEARPNVIVRLGDCWDMPSLCSYDKGKKSFVFQSVRDDIEAGHKGEALIFGPMIKYNERQRKNGKAQYKPLILKILGNHEDRVRRLLEFEPRWEGSISMNDFKTRLPIKETIIPFGQVAIIDEIAYSHYFVSGVKGNAYSSARSMVTKRGMSCTMGHTHILDSATITTPHGRNLRALIAGSFHDPDHESFAGPQVDKVWWNGILHKHNVVKGSYDLEEISIDRLRKKYEKP